MKRLAGLLAVQAGEGRLVALLIGLMLVTALGAGIGTSGVEALFFARLGTAYLPLIYMIQGVLTLVLTLAVSGLLSRFSRNVIYVLLPLAMAGLLVGERFLAGFTWFLPVIWLLKEVMNSLLGLYVWGVAGALCDTRQAKRLFPLFGAGRILGAVLGGLATGPLVGLLGTENLLFVWAGSMGLAFVLTQVLLGRGGTGLPELGRGRAASAGNVRRRRGPGFIQEVQQGYQFVRGSALMRWVSVAAVLFSALYFSLALPFSKAAAAQFPDEASLAGFLGLFQALSTAAAFLASLLVANRLYARFGVMAAILALPVVYLAGFGVLAVFPAFPALVVFKFMQMLWLAGIADSAYQAMFNAVPGERRDQVRAFVGGVPEQAGTFIAGFILIVGEQALDSQQLYLIGLALGLACTCVIWQAGRAYSGALVAALKAGRPQLFIGSDSLTGIQKDAAAAAAVVAGLGNPDLVVRRVSAEILGSISIPQAAGALVNALTDSDPQVRASALRALAKADAAPALLDVAACLQDGEADVRLEAVVAVGRLAGFPGGLQAHLQPLLQDPDPRVRAGAAVALQRVGPHPDALALLRRMAALGEIEERVSALTALGDLADGEAFVFIAHEVQDEAAPPVVRRAAARALAGCGPDAVSALVQVLADEDRSVREAGAVALGQIGRPAQAAVAEALFRPEFEHGAIHALEYLPVEGVGDTLRNYAARKVQRAVELHGSWSVVDRHRGDDRTGLLADSLQDAARRHSLHALRAVNLLGDRQSLVVVMDNLRSRDANQRANALETLESVREAALLRPMLKVWEIGVGGAAAAGEPPAGLGQALAQVLADPDAWLRACAAFAAGGRHGPETVLILNQLAETDPDDLVRFEARRALEGASMDTLATLSLMERILFLKRVSLFADLPPADLKQVAGIAGEMLYGDGDLLMRQGELGEEMFVIVSGEVVVRVSVAGKPDSVVARRKRGDIVGETAIISQQPRNATLVAAGEVRTLCIDRHAFEALLRERPEVSLAVMRVLCARLTELSK